MYVCVGGISKQVNHDSVFFFFNDKPGCIFYSVQDQALYNPYLVTFYSKGSLINIVVLSTD